MARLDDYGRIQKRVTDTVIQARCDRRTLATLATYFIKERGYVSSISNLVNSSMELLKDILVGKDVVEDVLSTEDAINMMRQVSDTGLNPGGRNRKTLINQLEKEDIFLDGGNLEYMGHTKTKTNAMQEQGSQELNKLLGDKSQLADIAKDVIRRRKEQEETSDGLKHYPENLAKKEE